VLARRAGGAAEMSNYFPKKENTDEKLLDYTPLLRFSDDVLVLLEIGTASALRLC